VYNTILKKKYYCSYSISLLSFYNKKTILTLLVTCLIFFSVNIFTVDHIKKIQKEPILKKKICLGLCLNLLLMLYSVCFSLARASAHFADEWKKRKRNNKMYIYFHHKAALCSFSSLLPSLFEICNCSFNWLHSFRVSCTLWVEFAVIWHVSSCCLWLYSDRQQHFLAYPDGFFKVWTAKKKKKHMKSYLKKKIWFKPHMEEVWNAIPIRFFQLSLDALAAQIRFQTVFYTKTLLTLQGIYEWKLLLA